MKCQFDSYPPPTIQWVKMIRTVIDPDGGQVLVQDNDPQVIDILTRQIGPTIYETQLTVQKILWFLFLEIRSCLVQSNGTRFRFEFRMSCDQSTYWQILHESSTR